MYKEKILKILKILLGAVLSIILLVIICHWGLGVGPWHGTSYEKYLNRAWKGKNFIGLPDDVQDFRFYCKSSGLGAYSVSTFSLTDAEYADYIASLDRFTKDMFYDPNKLVGKKVPETYEVYDSYGHFAGLRKERVEKVINSGLEDYTIIYMKYYSVGDAYTFAVASKDGTNCLLVYNYGTN